MLMFHQILRLNESFHTFLIFSFINLTPCYSILIKDSYFYSVVGKPFAVTAQDDPNHITQRDCHYRCDSRLHVGVARVVKQSSCPIKAKETGGSNKAGTLNSI